jgi:hypothetical protein
MRKNRLLPLGLIAVCGANLPGHPLPAREPLQNPSPYTYVHHPVSTSFPAAQFAFDRGLTMVFAYQPEEGERAFREAARLDPSLAMAWWGIALAVGPNINIQPEPRSTEVAAEAMARARILAQNRATAAEREYIDALSARYSSEPTPDFDKLATAYREAMGALVGRHPEDADAAALYAESIMDLRAWRLWSNDGQPAPGTQELVALLERSLRTAPQHIGLLHYYIHAVEASSDPGRALSVAQRLGALPMEPAAAHLVHMPSHIYLRVGDWRAAIGANEHSIHHALDYRLSNDPKQQRACGHCVDFLTYAYMMVGDEAHARSSAQDFEKLSGDPSNSMAVLWRFGAWDDLLAFPEPAAGLKPQSDRNVHAVLGLWHYGRGLALTAQHRLDRADQELSALTTDAALLPPSPVFGDTPDVQHSLDKLSQAGDIDCLRIAAATLRARMAEARGQSTQEMELLREAVRIQDATPYGEPPSWPYPVRESLGSALLRQNAPAEAERTFRDGLRLSPHDPRLLLGLSEALRAQGDDAGAAAARAEFQALWRGPAELRAGEL